MFLLNIVTMTEYSVEILNNRIKSYKAYSLSSKLHKSIRRANFPEDISENIVKFFLDCEKIIPGDLYSVKYGKIEVKCFSSTGPISFGPRETWETLIVLDATNFLDDIYTVHVVSISSRDFDVKINKKETYKDQVYQKRRPRISWKSLKTQVISQTKSFNILVDNSSTIGNVTELPANL
jgi:hypothetical protein